MPGDSAVRRYDGDHYMEPVCLYSDFPDSVWRDGLRSPMQYKIVQGRSVRNWQSLSLIALGSVDGIM